MRILSAALIGILFGSGLVVSGMVDPAVVLGFLDVLGDWNPALAFVMAAALAMAFPGYRLAIGRKPLLAERQSLPTSTDIDRPLLLGAVLFGLGWGLAGICPGPAVTLLGIRPDAAAIFLAGTAAGILLVRFAMRAPPASAKPKVSAGAADG